MATARQPPKFARSGSSALSAASFHGSFSATAASTPAGTPPPPSQTDMQNGPPTIYTAVYSGVPVYEMTVNNVAVMRRREDSWLNATQILKVAGVEKGKRTKVLEKEILSGKHEKVQGGYGKYQGTWIDFQRGRDFCKAYGVGNLLAPLLDLDPNATDRADTTPTKEQAMAAKRKRMYNSSLSHSNGSNVPLFSPISSTVQNAFTALGKASARVESPAPRQSYATIAPQASFRQESFSNENYPPPPASLVSESSYSQSQPIADSTYASQNFHLVNSQPDVQEPPRKRARASTPVNEMPPELFQNPIDTPVRSLPPINPLHVADADRVRQRLMNLFINPECDPVATLDGLSAEQADIPVDGMGNSSLHWAASLANITHIRALIARGASIYRVNDGGESALVRGVFCTNNFDMSSFPQLLNILHPIISITDNNGRTILHHIALKSGMKGRSADGRYYLHCLLEFIAKHGASSTQRGSGPKVMNLGKFIAEIVNAQDKSGDTALNIAARIGNRSIVNPLLEVGADSNIPNRAGLRPVDFGIGGEPALVPKAKEQSWTVPPAVVQKREDIVHSMKEVIAGIEKEFQGEIELKQEQVSSTLNQLREATLRLGKERDSMNQLRQRSRENAELRQHCRNLRRAIEEENARFSETFTSTNGDMAIVVSGKQSADAAYALQTQLLAPVDTISNLSSQQLEYVKSLPSSVTLKARLRAYRLNDDALKDKAARLHDRSTELEEKFRRVVALCTGVEDDRVDSLLEGLVQAVESDPGEVDTARVTSFLRKVDESVGSD
ncbi:hypothetical protein EDC01DRAFT_308917 [Geopyxis carbonaria]|nr:hypothetical protein EDC01DRAFT_308917 [Geopyxis carbonaria]